MFYFSEPKFKTYGIGMQTYLSLFLVMQIIKSCENSPRIVNLSHCVPEMDSCFSRHEQSFAFSHCIIWTSNCNAEETILLVMKMSLTHTEINR